MATGSATRPKGRRNFTMAESLTRIPQLRINHSHENSHENILVIEEDSYDYKNDPNSYQSDFPSISDTTSYQQEKCQVKNTYSKIEELLQRAKLELGSLNNEKEILLNYLNNVITGSKGSTSDGETPLDKKTNRYQQA